MRRFRGLFTSLGLTVVTLAVVAPPAANAQGAIGAFGDWAAFRDGGGNPRCYIVSPPASTKASASNIRRGAAALSIGLWPDRKIDGQVYAEVGFPIDAGAAATLKVGSRSFTLLPEGEAAWAENAGADETIITALRRGNTAEVTTTSRRGTRVTDRYSLKGFSAALDAARSACRGKSNG